MAKPNYAFEKRQKDLAKKNPIIVEADPKIVSLSDGQPQFKLIEGKSMRYIKQFGLINKDAGSIADSKLVRLKQKDFLKCLNKR